MGGGVTLLKGRTSGDNEGGDKSCLPADLGIWTGDLSVCDLLRPKWNFVFVSRFIQDTNIAELAKCHPILRNPTKLFQTLTETSPNSVKGIWKAWKKAKHFMYRFLLIFLSTWLQAARQIEGGVDPEKQAAQHKSERKWIFWPPCVRLRLKFC